MVEKYSEAIEEKEAEIKQFEELKVKADELDIAVEKEDTAETLQAKIEAKNASK